MDFSVSVEIVSQVVKEILPFIVVITVTMVLLKFFVKGLKGKL